MYCTTALPPHLCVVQADSTVPQQYCDIQQYSADCTTVVLSHLCVVQAGHGIQEGVHVLTLLAGLLLHVQPQHATPLVGSPVARRYGRIRQAVGD